jgi:transcriptional regulator with XRE-family HTH domain
MFNMISIGRKIAQLRKTKNLTQMEMADMLDISFQAISNWERGQTMPDISKLPEIAEIFGVSIDEILENEKGTHIVKVITEGKTKEYLKQNQVSFEEFSNVAPLLKTVQSDEVFENINDKLSTKDIYSILPYISNEIVDKCAKKAFEIEGMDSLTSIAPFISSEVIDELAIKAFDLNGLNALVTIAPFISDNIISTCARKSYEATGINSLIAMCPYIDDNVIDELAIKVFELNGINALVPIAPYISDNVITTCARKSYKAAGINSLTAMCPYIDGKVINELVLDAISATS